MIFLGGGGMGALPVGPLLGLGLAVLAVVAAVFLLRALLEAVARGVGRLLARRRGSR